MARAKAKAVPEHPDWVRACRDPRSYSDALAKARELGPIDQAKKVYEILAPRALKEDQEVFYVLSLDPHLQLRHLQEVARGARDQVQVPVSDTFRTAVLAGATAIIVAHNHPTGSPKPSSADREMTEALAEAGETIGVALMDHVVLGMDGEYFSFVDEGLLKGGHWVGAGEGAREACRACGGEHGAGEACARTGEEARRPEPVDEVAKEELKLYLYNTSELYPKHQAIIQNLQRRIAKGTYDPRLAPTLWEYWVEDGARRYAREFASPSEWSMMFPPALRRALAAEIAEEEFAKIQGGEYRAMGETSAHTSHEAAVDAVARALAAANLPGKRLVITTEGGAMAWTTPRVGRLGDPHTEEFFLQLPGQPYPVPYPNARALAEAFVKAVGPMMAMNALSNAMAAGGAQEGAQDRVVSPDGTERQVKNLGWLLKHWKEVDSFRVIEHPQKHRWDAVMYAYLRDGRVFVADWASREVMREWLDRPVFRGVFVDWFGVKTEAGQIPLTKHGQPPPAVNEAALEAIELREEESCAGCRPSWMGAPRKAAGV